MAPFLFIGERVAGVVAFGNETAHAAAGFDEPGEFQFAVRLRHRVRVHVQFRSHVADRRNLLARGQRPGEDLSGEDLDDLPVDRDPGRKVLG